MSAQPEKLYRARMAEFKTPFFRSFLVNEPTLLQQILKDRPEDFPKSHRVGAGLRPLLGNSVFVTNGAEWQFQRRIIDPAFEGGRLRETFSSMLEAANSACDRFNSDADTIEIEELASFTAADVIFRTLFSIPIDHKTANAVFQEFQTYQRTQPIVNVSAFFPRLFSKAFLKGEARVAAKRIRNLISELTTKRHQEIATGHIPDDLASKIMMAKDPVTGVRFSPEEMIDQVSIFFLAGHETSASALAWSLYLLATYPDWQEKIVQEVTEFNGEFSDLAKLKVTRNVFREALRLYPPVPMMVRETVQNETFRDRLLRKGALVVMSPWHLHRHQRHWERPDEFDPGRWTTEAGKISQRDAYLPFSAGPRVCPGAGFAMMEGVLLISQLVKKFRFEPVEDRVPVPVAHLTVRSKDGIWLRVTTR